ncbi:MAG: bifunctional nuclease family protein [Ectothiorhodospiraceae bacterium]|nr:bifunctional nuclease family protein [Ectothiorhodospiraceae bacterium]
MPSPYPTTRPWQHCLLAALLVLALSFSTTQARELAVPEDELIPVELATVGVIPGTGAPVVLLREPESGDVVPIFVGVAEARSILMALRDVPVQRPQTHDLMRDVFGASGITLERVMVDDLVDGTYLGMLKLKLPHQEEPVLVDTRPSDGLALALRSGAAILVAPRVLEAGRGLEYEGLGEDQVVTALGITVEEATAELRQALELPDDAGVLVSGATGRAAEAGVEPGSLLLTVNDQAPDSPMHFLELVRETPPGERATITYWKDGERHEARLPTDVPPPAPGDGPRLSL